MASPKKPTPASVLAAMLKLSPDQQLEFVWLAVRHGDNAIASIRLSRDLYAARELIAFDEQMMTEVRLRRMKRKPDWSYGREVVRLRDEEGLSFGQIGKRLKRSHAAVRQAYNRTKRRLQGPTSR